ncbi:MAG: hypothetical protein HYS87_00425 [Candidatus Colwellbacteria bacterium]|nr:hypothetical protein [Candidatus Colwellbacteria bacterium]
MKHYYVFCRYCGERINRPSLSPDRSLWLTESEHAGQTLRKCRHEPVDKNA